MTKPFEKLTPEELQRLRADMQEALNAARQEEAEKEIHEQTLDAVIDRTDRFDLYDRWNGIHRQEKISGGDAGKFHAFLIGDDFDLEAFKTFVGDTAFSATFEFTGSEKVFKHLSVSKYSHLYPGDYVFKSNEGKIFGARVSY
jgi:hypothetical protein